MELTEQGIFDFLTDYDSNLIRKYLITRFEGKPFSFLHANFCKQTMQITKISHFNGAIDEKFLRENIVIIDSFYNPGKTKCSIDSQFVSAVNNIQVENYWTISLPDSILVYLKLLNQGSVTVYFLGTLFQHIRRTYTNTYHDGDLFNGDSFEIRLDSIRSADECVFQLTKLGYVDTDEARP